MKNFKKVLSLVLALAMVLSTMTVAFAADATTTEDKTAVLYVLGLFDGYDDDAAYTPALENGATREEAMKLIAVAFGWTIEEGATSIFTDVSDWAQPYVKVAYEMGVTQGYDADAGIFGGSDSVSPRQIKTFFDRMLTGEDTWEANAALSEEPATRAEMVDAMWDALMSTKEGEDAPLINAILADKMDVAPTRTVDGVEGTTMGEVAETAGLYEAPALTVMTIAAVNKSTIKVDFDTAVDTLAVENVTVMVGGEAKTVETAVLNPAGTTATITIPGLAYGDDVEVTLTGLAVGGVVLEDVKKTVEIPALNDLYELAVSSDAALDTIKSDGATKTMLSAKLVEKATGDVVTLDGVVNFSATKGGLAQSEVTLEDGIANVQLTSAASDASVVSYITVTIVDAPSATEYEGITAQFEVYFEPDVADDTTTTFVQIATAESNQADRLFVTFSGDVSASAYKAALAAKVSSTTTWADIDGTLSAFIEIDGAKVALDDVLQKGANVLEFILATDSTGSGVPATTEIKTGWTSATPAYLRDNALHTLSYTDNLGSLVLANSDGVQFIVTDAKRPFIYGVTAANQVSFEVNFSESMAEDMIEGTRGLVNPYFLIDGKQVYLTDSETAGLGDAADPAELALAATNNYIIVRDLYVGDYVAGDHDTRNVVTFRIDNAHALAAGGHIIQIANVSDWAGLSDVNNRVTTQTFDFTVAADTSKPVPTLVVQSPEQWKLMFDELVVLDGTTAEAFEIYKADDTSNKLVDGTDYEITELTIGTTTQFLIEFKEDWTVDYNTSGTGVNYWTSTKNPYQVKILAGEVEDLLSNAADAVTKTATLPIDVTSPIILSAVDKSTVVSSADPGEAIRVTMNEPVQIEVAGVDSTLAINNFMTPSQQQTILAGSPAIAADAVPQPTFEFVKGDTTVEGTLSAFAGVSGETDPKEDMVFDVTPASVLEAGTWTLYIRNLTDDVGNAYNTQAYALVVPKGASTVTDTKIAWAAFDNGADDAGVYDYLYIKFTKDMDPTGASGVSRTTNYVFNGVALPTGSQVYAGITGITNGWDGVTIRMPRQAFIDDVTTASYAADFAAIVYPVNADDLNGDTVVDAADQVIADAAYDAAFTKAYINATSVLNVANNFKAADGEALTGPFEVELADTASVSFGEKDGLDATDQFEAIYYNTSASSLVAGGAVLIANADDSDEDGDIDTVTLTMSKSVTTDGTELITFGGKTFINVTAGAAAAQVFEADDATVTTAATSDIDNTITSGSAVATNEIAGTATATLALTATNGGKMVSAGKVDDDVAPVLIAAKLTEGDTVAANFGDDNDVLTLTYSEKVNTLADYSAASAFTAGLLATLVDIDDSNSAFVAPAGHTSADRSAATGTASATIEITFDAAGTVSQYADLPITVAGLAIGTILDADLETTVAGDVLSTVNGAVTID